MFFQKPDLTSGSRPTLSPDETLLLVQDGVGLYEGKYKIASCQKGHAYLTSHRVCYVDDLDPRTNSLAVDLKDVERHEFQAGFLKSSSKITLYPKPPKRGFGSLHKPVGIQSPHVQRVTSSSSPVSRAASPFRPSAISAAPQPVAIGSWICPICSFSNPVPSNFDPAVATEAFPLPPCLACGIKPSFSLVLKAAVSALAKSAGEVTPLPDPPRQQTPYLGGERSGHPDRDQARIRDGGNICPRCTFGNYPSLRFCELCDAPLPFASRSPLVEIDGLGQRSESPGPEITGLSLDDDTQITSVKLSFRNGGEKVFYERLKNAMIQRRWLLQNAPPIPRADVGAPPTPSNGVAEQLSSENRTTAVGIAGLEQRGLQSRKINETVLGNAFEDLEALMASAKDVVALAEKFAIESRTDLGNNGAMSSPLLSQSAAAMGMVATKDVLGDSSNTLYFSELARRLAEYVTDERGGGVLHAQGGTMSLVDLWAMFNRSQNGVELVSPADFHKAAQTWETLGLPIRLRQFKSGLLVVQRRNWTDEKTIGELTSWLRSLQRTDLEDPPAWDWATYGCGVTIPQTAAKFGWSLGVATEELEMAEEKGALCREEGVEGLKFWLNYLTEDDTDALDE